MSVDKTESGYNPMTDGEPAGKPHLERGLSNRHIQLIAIGGAIGTGLFMGSGKTISVAGPSVIFVIPGHPSEVHHPIPERRQHCADPARGRLFGAVLRGPRRP
jgi:hypothetical protein